MRAGHEACLIRGGCQVHATFQHGVEEAVESSRIAGDGLRVRIDLLVGEEQAEHAAYARGGEWNAGVFGGLFQAIAQRIGRSGESFMEAGRLHPVSYTHLDVYKRQDQYREEIFQNFL